MYSDKFSESIISQFGGSEEVQRFIGCKLSVMDIVHYVAKLSFE